MQTLSNAQVTEKMAHAGYKFLRQNVFMRKLGKFEVVAIVDRGIVNDAGNSYMQDTVKTYMNDTATRQRVPAGSMTLNEFFKQTIAA